MTWYPGVRCQCTAVNAVQTSRIKLIKCCGLLRDILLCECWLVNSLPVRGTEFWNIAATDIFTNMNTKHIFVIMGPAGCGKTYLPRPFQRGPYADFA